MTKPLCRFDASVREAVALRRARQENVKGLGYWSAIDYIESKRKPNVVRKKEEKKDG